MKRALSFLFALILALGALCGAATAEELRPIRVGVACALTGDIALVGWAEKAGAQLAADEINAAGGIDGRMMELYFEDTAGDNAEAVNAVRKLINDDKVDIIIGPCGSGYAIAATPLVTQAHIPMMTTTATNPRVTVNEDGSLNEWVWRQAFIDNYQGEVIAEYGYKKLGLRKAAIIYDVSSDYAQGLIEFFTNSFTALGGEIVSEQGFKAGDLDFRALLSNLKSQDFDLLFFPNSYKELALCVNQMAELGITGKQVMCGDSAMSANAVEIAGHNLDGTFICTYFSTEDGAVRKLIDRVIKTYGLTSEPEPNCVINYDMVYWVADVVKRAEGSIEPEALQKAINETKDLPLLSGKMTVDPETHNPLHKPAAMIQYQDAKQVFVENYEPTGTN